MIETQLPGFRAASFESLDDIQAAALDLLLSSGEQVSPRGTGTREVLGAGFCLRNPRKRCVTVPARQWSLPLAIGEFSWHASGSDSVDALEYYAKRWRAFADSASRIPGSCYGRMIFQKGQAGSSQWEQIVELLGRDRNSRRAVAILASPASSANTTAQDVACATSIQFLVRDGKLTAVVNMRSNDVIWGLPYDVFLFTMMQELLANTLKLDLGAYYHFAGSLHLYDQHRALATRIVADTGDPSFEMPPMRRVDQLSNFLAQETRIRRGAASAALPLGTDAYWRSLLEVLLWFAQRKGGHSRPFQAMAPRSPYAGLVKNILVEV